MKHTDKAIEEMIDEQLPAVEEAEVKPADETTVNDDEEAAPDAKPEATPEVPAEPEVRMVAVDEVNRLVAEAEARGYLRGRNEVVAESVNTPRLWENPRRTAMEQEESPDPADGFLSKIRPGVWD